MCGRQEDLCLDSRRFFCLDFTERFVCACQEDLCLGPVGLFHWLLER